MDPELDNLGSGRLKMVAGRTFKSLKHRNFRLYFIGQTISNTGNWLTIVALTLLVLKITGSGLDVGLLAAAQFGPLLVLSPLGGAIADRSDKRRLLFVTQTLEMLQSFGLAALAFMPHPPLLGLYALAVAGGVFLSLDNPLRRSLVNEMVPLKDVHNAIVLYSTIVNTSRLFGPALAGLLITTLGYGWAFLIDGLSYSSVLLCLYLMNPAQLRRGPMAIKAKGQVRAGLRYVKSHPSLWVSFVMLTAIGTLGYNLNVTLPLFVTDSLHRSGEVFTVLYSLFSAGAIVGGLLVAHRNFVTMRHITMGATALGASMLLLSLAPNLAVAAPISFLLGMSAILYTTSTTAHAQVQADSRFRGRVLSLQTALLVGTAPIGGPLLGLIADATDARMPIIIGGLICLAAAIFGYSAATQRMGLPDNHRGKTKEF